MSTNVTRVKKQLAESCKACEGLKEQLRSNPDNTILPVRIVATEERMGELEKSVKQAEADERRTGTWDCIHGVTEAVGRAVAKFIQKLKLMPACGFLANSDLVLDEVVEKNDGILLVCNADSLLRIVRHG